MPNAVWDNLILRCPPSPPAVQSGVLFACESKLAQLDMLLVAHQSQASVVSVPWLCCPSDISIS